MTQADRVLSTPPTNTSATAPQSSRRGFLVQAAGVAAGGAAIGAGLPLPAPSAAAAQTLDAELIELAARFEPLLDQYYPAHRRWSEALGHAQAEHDQEFGLPKDRNYEYPPEVVAGFNDSCERAGVDEASDALSAIYDNMKPLANAISRAPVNSIEGLRAKGLGRVLGGPSPIRRRH